MVNNGSGGGVRIRINAGGLLGTGTGRGKNLCEVKWLGEAEKLVVLYCSRKRI